MLENALQKPDLTTKNELLYQSKKREERRMKEGQILASSGDSNFASTHQSGFGITKTSGFPGANSSFNNTPDIPNNPIYQLQENYMKELEE